MKKQSVYTHTINSEFMVYKVVKKRRKEIANFLTFLSLNMKLINKIGMVDDGNIIYIDFEVKKYYYSGSNEDNKMKYILEILSKNYWDVPFKIMIFSMDSKMIYHCELKRGVII